MINLRKSAFLFLLILTVSEPIPVQSQPAPDEINFVRQGVRRFLFDESHTIPLATLNPKEIIGMSAMYPITHYSEARAAVEVRHHQLTVRSDTETQTAIWFGGFNPFATYTVDLASCEGEGAIGFEFSDAAKAERYVITVNYQQNHITNVHQKLVKDDEVMINESIATNTETKTTPQGKLILQMLGSGLTLYIQNDGLPLPIGQSDFSKHIDLRKKTIPAHLPIEFACTYKKRNCTN